MVRAIAELAEREKSRRHLLDFACRVYPGYERTQHGEYLAECLERAERREPGWRRLVFSVPPQHGKSTLVSRIFPAWCLGREPRTRIILTSYSDDLALDFSQTGRDIVSGEDFQKLFPAVTLAQDTRAKNKWNVVREGRQLGTMQAAGILGSITGKGADLLIMDDVFKNREEAESKRHREKIMRQYISVLSTRMSNVAVGICMMSRWHEDDLSGWLLKKSGEGYREIRLPAMAEKDDILGRLPYAPLWPSRFPQPFLLQKRRMMGAYDWFSMYQGAPRPPEGSIFKRAYFQRVPRCPDNLLWARFWDLATTTSTMSDYTASLSCAMDDQGNAYLRRGVRGKWEWGNVREKIKTTALVATDAVVGVESVGMQKGMVQELWKDTELANIGILGVPVSQDKIIRAIGLATRGEIGKLYIVEDGDNDWIEPFIEEAVSFPSGEHDDYVDAATGAFALAQMYAGLNVSLM